MHKVRKRDWWGAFQDGCRGISNLKKAIKLDTTLYDAYHGLGTYHYWRGAKAGALRFLPFFKNDKQRGLKETLLAINKGKYTSDEAKFGLVAIYYDCKEYEKALSVNQELYELYATNASCLYMRSRILDQQEKWEEAVEAYQNLLNHLLNSEFRNIGYEIECHYHLAYCHYKLGQFDDALKHVQKSLSLKNQRYTSIEMEGPLEDYNEIVKKAIKLHKKLTNKVVEREIPIRKSISFNLTKFKT